MEVSRRINLTRNWNREEQINLHKILFIKSYFEILIEVRDNVVFKILIYFSCSERMQDISCMRKVEVKIVSIFNKLSKD